MTILKELTFTQGNSSQDAYERTARGVQDGVLVELTDGTRYELTFYDPVRLAQDIARTFETTRQFFLQCNVVVVPLVTEASIRSTVSDLAKSQGAFRLFAPVPNV